MSDSETSFAEQMARRSLEALEQKYPGSTKDGRVAVEPPREPHA